MNKLQWCPNLVLMPWQPLLLYFTKLMFWSKNVIISYLFFFFYLILTLHEFMCDQVPLPVLNMMCNKVWWLMWLPVSIQADLLTILQKVKFLLFFLMFETTAQNHPFQYNYWILIMHIYLDYCKIQFKICIIYWHGDSQIGLNTSTS